MTVTANKYIFLAIKIDKSRKMSAQDDRQIFIYISLLLSPFIFATFYTEKFKSNIHINKQQKYNNNNTSNN